MSAAITIAMPRMVPNQLLAEAHAKYPESLARAGAEMRWIELDDPEKAVQDALACDGLLLPGGGDIDPKFYGQERIPACGAFVEIAPGHDGMVHISKLENRRVEKVEDVLNVGDMTWVKFMGFDEKGRANFSRKDALKEIAESEQNK